MSTKTAIVTGAGSGIGRATAVALAKEEWHVALTGRHRDTLDATSKLLPKESTYLVIPTVVTVEADVSDLFKEVIAQWGRVDLLFNNAGTSAPSVPLDQLSMSQWQGVVDVNLTGMFLCIREAFRAMKTQHPMGGRIINNGSLAAHVPRPNSIAYTATKHAVTGLTRSAALDGRAHRIAVGQIDIGNAATEFAIKGTQGVTQANGELAWEPLLDVDMAAQSVTAMANLSPEANVLFQTVMATNMPFVGRG